MLDVSVVAVHAHFFWSHFYIQSLRPMMAEDMLCNDLHPSDPLSPLPGQYYPFNLFQLSTHRPITEKVQQPSGSLCSACLQPASHSACLWPPAWFWPWRPWAVPIHWGPARAWVTCLCLFTVRSCIGGPGWHLAHPRVGSPSPCHDCFLSRVLSPLHMLAWFPVSSSLPIHRLTSQNDQLASQPLQTSQRIRLPSACPMFQLPASTASGSQLCHLAYPSSLSSDAYTGLDSSLCLRGRPTYLPSSITWASLIQFSHHPN